MKSSNLISCKDFISFKILLNLKFDKRAISSDFTFFLVLILSFAIWMQRSSIRSKIKRFVGDSEGFITDGGFLVGFVIGLESFEEGFLGAIEGFKGPEDYAISLK